MTRRAELGAATGADHEPDLVVIPRSVAREAKQPRQKRAGAALSKLLKSASQPMIHGDPPSRWWHERTPRNAHARLLMREQPFEPQPIVHRNVDNAAESGCSVQVNGLTGDTFKEIPSEPIAGERGPLDGRGSGARRPKAKTQGNDRQKPRHGSERQSSLAGPVDRRDFQWRAPSNLGYTTPSQKPDAAIHGGHLSIAGNSKSL